MKSLQSNSQINLDAKKRRQEENQFAPLKEEEEDRISRLETAIMLMMEQMNNLKSNNEYLRANNEALHEELKQTKMIMLAIQDHASVQNVQAILQFQQKAETLVHEKIQSATTSAVPTESTTAASKPSTPRVNVPPHTNPKLKPKKTTSFSVDSADSNSRRSTNASVQKSETSSLGSSSNGSRSYSQSSRGGPSLLMGKTSVPR